MVPNVTWVDQGRIFAPREEKVETIRCSFFGDHFIMSSHLTNGICVPQPHFHNAGTNKKPNPIRKSMSSGTAPCSMYVVCALECHRRG